MTDAATPPAEPATQEEMDAADATLATLLIELRGRGKNLPIGQLKMECLLDAIMPAGTPERRQFDYMVTATAVGVARSMLSTARREELTRP